MLAMRPGAGGRGENDLSSKGRRHSVRGTINTSLSPLGILSDNILRRCSWQGPHLAMTGEPRGFPRVAAGFSNYDGEFRFPLLLAQGYKNHLEGRC